MRQSGHTILYHMVQICCDHAVISRWDPMCLTNYAENPEGSGAGADVRGAGDEVGLQGRLDLGNSCSSGWEANITPQACWSRLPKRK